MFFGVEMESGKVYTQEPDMPLHLSMATIQPSKQADGPLVSVYCHSNEQKFLICSLDPVKNYQVSLDLSFIEGETVTLSTEGPGKVYLTGYYMPEPDMDFEDESGSELDEEVDSEDVDDENVADAPKRPVAVKDTAGPVAKKIKTDAGQTPAKPKENGQAVLKKKAVPVAEDEDDEEDDDDEDDDSDDEAGLNAILSDIKKARGKAEAGAGDKMQVSGEEEDDDEDDDDDDDDDEGDEFDEEDDDEDISVQQKQLKQSLQPKAAGQQPAKPQQKPQNGQAAGKGFQKPQGNKTQFGNRPHQAGGQNRGNFQNKGNRGTPGNQNSGKFERSPGSGGSFRGGRGGRGGGRGGGGGTPFNKNKNFSPGSGGQKFKGKKF